MKSEIIIDKLILSERKTISIEINRYAELIVRANKKTSHKLIERFVKEKEGWILGKKALVLQRLDEKPQMLLEFGSKVLFAGKELEIEAFDKSFISPEEGKVYIKRDRAVNEAIIQLYKKQAKLAFPQRILQLAAKANLTVNNIRVSGAKGRWGSCSSRKNINISWRLVMAPPRVADYVIIHELAHLAHPNHSKNFWNLVELWYPGYKPAKKWLKENGHLLEI